MSRFTRCLRVAAFVVAGPAFAQNVTVTLPAPPMPSIQVVAPAPVVVVPAPVVVQHRTVVVEEHQTVIEEQHGNRGKHKGQRK